MFHKGILLVRKQQGKKNKASRNTPGKLMGLHTSNVVVMLTDIRQSV